MNVEIINYTEKLFGIGPFTFEFGKGRQYFLYVNIERNDGRRESFWLKFKSYFLHIYDFEAKKNNQNL